MQSQYLLKYLSTAPVFATVCLFVIAGALIEFNRFFPDLLFHPLP
ncbi:photosystem I reaction center subunit IX [Cyanobacteria bacterium FACHB-471]|nr:photosystem I reaction center subunit IX [Cyanobacteria bacterium FACHB-471]